MTQNKTPESPLSAALKDAGVIPSESTAAPSPTSAVTIGKAVVLIDDAAPGLNVGDGDFDRLFTHVNFVPVSGDVYARERERRNKPSLTVGFSRKVAEVQIELAGTGAYMPGTISMVQGVNETEAHLEMSVGVWNPETRQSSIKCATEATKERFQTWKDKTCSEFLAQCNAQGIDLTAPTVKAHANSLKVSLLGAAKPTTGQ